MSHTYINVAGPLKRLSNTGYNARERHKSISSTEAKHHNTRSMSSTVLCHFAFYNFVVSNQTRTILVETITSLMAKVLHVEFSP